MKTLKLTVEDHIATLTVDQPKSRVNTITSQLISEFDEILDNLEQDDLIRALIITGGKQNRFISGADIRILLGFRKRGDALAFSRKANSLLSRLTQLPIPVIAAIHGPALGGGLEVALACDYRIATDDTATRFALPEVNLGLCPAAGGSQRLPALIGTSGALSMLLTGRNVYPREALETGLVDELIHEHGLMKAARNMAVMLMDRKEGTRQKSRMAKAMETVRSNPVTRRMLFTKAEKEVQKKTRGRYPAPKAILECVQYGLKHGLEKGLEYESETFDALSVTPESRQLVLGYYKRQSVRENPSKAKPRKVEQIGVLGAGLMGSGITAVSVANGFGVTLKDRDIASAIRGKEASWKELSKRVHARSISEFERDRLLAGIHITDNYRDLEGLPFVIEAVFEELSLKRSVLAESEEVLPDNAVFASNTSAIPISEIAASARRPERVIGMHFFSPARKMPLIEIIRGRQTDEEVVATACDIGLRQGKYVIVVDDQPGFYISRIVVPMINEAMHLIEEGADIRIIDTAMKDFGFPVGPVNLSDEVGIDVVSHVMETLAPVFKKRGILLNQSIHRLYESGFAGRKNRRGFYDYRDNKGLLGRQKLINDEVYDYFGGSRRRDFSLKQIRDRITLVMISEAVHCLQDSVIARPSDGDIGAVLGMGFPAYRGGPFRYIDQEGPKAILDRLSYWRNLHGERFKPAAMLADRLTSRKTFY